MSTNAEYVNITNKKLMSFEDFGTRMMDYLRELNREVTEIQFSEGSFSEKVPLDSPGAHNQVRISAKPTVGDAVVHDGYGHILDILANSGENVAIFENSNGITYEVGAGYVDIPSGIVINPRTGKPDYEKWIEGLGDSADPDAVTDNGSNITFRVDSLNAGGGESLAGRTVRVFKKILADGATTESVAIETLTVSFGGGQNTVTTTGLLGQSTVSTTASDYTVQLVGLSVRRNTNPAPISTSNSHFFAGTVLGNAGVPMVFDITNQLVIQADSAVAVTFNPYTGAAPISWGLAATTVQDAIEEIVDDLTSIAGGGNLIRIDPSAYNQQNPSSSLSWGGLGNSGDDVVDQLTKTNQQLVRARFGITHSSSLATMQADLQGVNDIITFWGNEKHYLKGAGTMSFTSSDMDKTDIPSIEGETPLKSKIAAPATTYGFNWYGVFRDLQLGTTLYSELGSDGPFHAQNCLIAPNAFQHLGGGNNTGGGALGGNEATSMRSCHVPDTLSGSGTPLSAGTFQVITNSTGVSVEYFSNCVFINETNGSPVLYTDGSPYNNSYAVSRKKVFINCAFIQKESGQYCLNIDGEDIHFIGCVIVIDAGGVSNYTEAIRLTSGNRKVTFENCYIYSDSGKLVSSAATTLRTTQRIFKNCHFSGAEADRDNSAQPAMIDTEGVDYIDCSFNLNATFMRFSGASDYVVDIREGNVIGCKFRKALGTTDERTIHTYEWMNFQDCKIDNLIIDIDEVFIDRDISGSDSYPSIVKFTNCTVRGFEFNFIPDSYTAGTVSWSFFNLRGRTIMTDVLVKTDFDTAGGTDPDPCIRILGDNCRISRARFEFVNSARPPNCTTSTAYIMVYGLNCVLEDLFLYGYAGQWYFGSSTENFASYARWFIKVMYTGGVGADNCVIRRVTTNKRSGGCINTKIVYFDGSTGGSVINGGCVEGCDITFAYEGQFVESDNNVQGLQITKNRAWQLSTATDMSNARWTDLNGADYCIVGDNIYLSEGAITPAVQNTGTGAVTHDNILASGVTLP